jgi:hypothetical protein
MRRGGGGGGDGPRAFRGDGGRRGIVGETRTERRLERRLDRAQDRVERRGDRVRDLRRDLREERRERRIDRRADRRDDRRDRRFWRRGARILWGGPAFYFYDGFYYGDCAWLRRRAIATGSQVWWRRYRLCRAGY